MEFYFVLVEPSVPGNIGAAARAIKTMGFRNLRLVNPCSYNNEEAVKMAHGSIDILEKVKVFNSLTEATEDIDFITGTTAKRRTAHEDYHKCSELPGILSGKAGTIVSVAVVLGREESGLTNDELQKCDLVTQIPMIREYPSINLAQAVMIYAYILSPFTLENVTDIVVKRNEEGLKMLKIKVGNVLDYLGINKNPTLYFRIKERLMLMEEDDIHLLHSIINKFKDKIGM